MIFEGCSATYCDLEKAIPIFCVFTPGLLPKCYISTPYDHGNTPKNRFLRGANDYLRGANDYLRGANDYLRGAADVPKSPTLYRKSAIGLCVIILIMLISIIVTEWAALFGGRLPPIISWKGKETSPSAERDLSHTTKQNNTTDDGITFIVSDTAHRCNECGKGIFNDSKRNPTGHQRPASI